MVIDGTCGLWMASDVANRFATASSTEHRQEGSKEERCLNEFKIQGLGSATTTATTTTAHVQVLLLPLLLLLTIAVIIPSTSTAASSS